MIKNAFILFIILILAAPIHARAICELTAVQRQQLTSLFSSSSLQPEISCHDTFLNLTFPVDNKSMTLELHVPMLLLKENHEFYGLAKYYNHTRPLQWNHWFGWGGRYQAFMVSGANTTMVLTDKTLELKWDAHQPMVLNIYLGPLNGVFAPLKYAHLWPWFAVLCRGIEAFFVILGALLGNRWGLAIIVLAIIFKFLCLPLQKWVEKLQQNLAHYQAVLKPKLKQIKSQYDGEEAHHRIMSEYKKLGITPFYSLKPLIGLLVPLPIQIAIFNVLSVIPQLMGASLWWMDDLAYPDRFVKLPITIPFLGNALNVLPLLMTFIAIFSTGFMQNPSGKYRLYFMSIIFLFLFYPFPAGIVLFWMMMNLLHALIIFRGFPRSYMK